MAEQTDNASGASGLLDWLLVAAAGVLLVGGLSGYYLLTLQPMWVRTLIVLAGVVLAVGAVGLSFFGREAWQFALGSRVELRKVVWPSWPDTRRMTTLVVVFVVIAGVFFWIIDWLLAWGTRHLLGTGA
jgi:preprotein translocase subunit SecE